MTIKTVPQIYVACISAYNSGYLHGEWIDATQDVEMIQKEIAEILADSPVTNSEEWAIHDYDGFGELSNALGEYPNLEEVVQLARLIEENGEIVIKLYLHCSDIKRTIQRLEEDYIGVYKDLAEYAEEITRDTSDVPDKLQYYINWDEMGEDMEINGEIISFYVGYEEVHVFHNN
jgi:antirestriction protein